MYDPHAVLSYLFDDCGLQIDQVKVRNYWAEAASRGCPWALGEPGDRDECVYDERLTKAYGIFCHYPYGAQTQREIRASCCGQQSLLNLWL